MIDKNPGKPGLEEEEIKTAIENGSLGCESEAMLEQSD